MARYTRVATGNDRRYRKPARPAVTASQEVQGELHRPAAGIAARSVPRPDLLARIPSATTRRRQPPQAHRGCRAPGCRAALVFHRAAARVAMFESEGAEADLALDHFVVSIQNN